MSPHQELDIPLSDATRKIHPDRFTGFELNEEAPLSPGSYTHNVQEDPDQDGTFLLVSRHPETQGIPIDLSDEAVPQEEEDGEAPEELEQLAAPRRTRKDLSTGLRTAMQCRGYIWAKYWYGLRQQKYHIATLEKGSPGKLQDEDGDSSQGKSE